MRKQKTSKSKKDEFFFDDCPICQAMKKAEERGKDLTEEELKEAFRKAKEKGGVVWGNFEQLERIKRGGR